MPARKGVTRSGILLRSDGIHTLTAGDVDLLIGTYGLVHVIDLRTSGERNESRVNPLAERGIRISALPILTDADIERRRLRLQPARQTGEILPKANGYGEYLDIGRAALAEAVSVLSAIDGVPALIHCTAGRDRTGALVAMLLDVAGVERESIISDYAATAERAEALSAKLNLLPRYQREAARLTSTGLHTRPETMAEFLELLDRESGGARAWFLANGVSERALERWADRLIEPVA